MRTTLTTRSTPAVLALGATLALTLSACGNGGSSTASSPSATQSSSAAGSSAGIDATHNDADVTFITDMAPHHEGAIAMADLASSRAGSSQVKDLAGRIAGAQGPEIETMKAMAAAWAVSLPTGSSMGDMSTMQGTGDDDVAALTPLSGAAFDREFLTRMTAHHTSAVEMAKTELSQGSNAQAKALATSIVSAQEKEIAEMAGLLKSV